MSAATMHASLNLFDFSKRDMTCLMIAAVVHSLLFLWTASSISFVEKEKTLGEEIVEVNFLAESSGLGGRARSAPPPKKRSLFGQVKKFFAAPAKPKKSRAAGELAVSSQNQKIQTDDSFLKKNTFSKLKNKKYSKTHAFSQMKKDDQLLSSGAQSQKAQVAKGNATFRQNAPQLKSKSFALARKDTPFQIKKAKDVDALSNMNAVAVNVGRKTSKSVTAFNDAPASPTLKGKSFSKSKGSSGAFGSRGGSAKSGGLAMGGSGKINPNMSSGLGRSAGSASSSSSSKGRSYKGGGTAFTGASKMASLPRNVVAGGGNDSGVRSGGKKSPFEIKGALSGRKILSNPIPLIREDVRVTLKFAVDWMGRVLDGIVVLAGSGNPSVDKKLREALLTWVFAKLPASKANVVQEGVITFRFIGR